MTFVPRARRPEKPRRVGFTEIRGPYYDAFGVRRLADIFDVAGAWIDGLKYAAGSFALIPPGTVEAMNALAHEHGAYVSTGGWIERVIPHGPRAIEAYLSEAKALGFDMVEVSAGFISLPIDSMLRLVEQVAEAGLRPRPELGVQFGAGGDTPAAELAEDGVGEPAWLIARARRLFDAGVEMITLESEGITENVAEWRTGIVASVVAELGLDRLLFEAAEPRVFEYYVKTYGNEVNLFVDSSQILRLEALRQGIWGTKSSWGRIHNP